MVVVAWSSFWIADSVIGKWGSVGLKASWDSSTEHFPTNWEVWLIGLLIIALLLIIEGSYRRANETERTHGVTLNQKNATIVGLQDQLTDVPLLRIAENGFFVDTRALEANSTVPPMKILLANLSCVHVKFKNDPKRSTPNSIAHNILAEIKVHDSISDATICQFYGRWGDGPQPPHLPPGQTPAQNLEMIDIGIGQERELDIAFKYQHEAPCFGMSNETYSYGDWRHPNQRIQAVNIRARVRLRGIGVDSSWDLWFENPQEGPLRILRQQEVQPGSRRERHA